MVEVLVALVVLSIGVLAVTGMAASSVTLVRNGFNLTNSTLAAQQVLDDYLVLPFDSLALGASYVWLCCGILLLLGIPAIFAALWLASRRRAGEEE